MTQIFADFLPPFPHRSRRVRDPLAAHALLQTRAARIHDDSLCQTFLHDVPEHRELLERYRVVFNAEAPRRKEKKTRDAD